MQRINRRGKFYPEGKWHHPIGRELDKIKGEKEKASCLPLFLCSWQAITWTALLLQALPTQQHSIQINTPSFMLLLSDILVSKASQLIIQFFFTMLQTRFLFALLFDNVSRQAWSQIPHTAKNDLELLILHLEYFDYTGKRHLVLCSTENLTQQKFMYARQVLRQLSYTSSRIQLSLICAFPSRLHQLWSLSSVIWVEANIINLKHH